MTPYDWAGLFIGTAMFIAVLVLAFDGLEKLDDNRDSY